MIASIGAYTVGVAFFSSLWNLLTFCLILWSSARVGCANEKPQAGEERIEVAGGVIDLRIAPRNYAVSHAELLKWVGAATQAVSTYYGKFPVRHLTLDIDLQDEGHGVHGVTFDGRLIRMGLGAHTAKSDLHDDWVLTHEMFHLAFPDMGESHQWMNEGHSTYLEPVARARIGILLEEEYWMELVEGLPKGEPEPGDRGLDRTHTWGRTYWGGAMFWFLADLRIREQTHNRKSLDDAMRAILDSGGDGSVEWSVQRVGRSADEATGTHVVSQLIREMSDAPVKIDLDAIWGRLGVRYRAAHVTLDDDAPAAAVRKAMIQKAPAQ